MEHRNDKENINSSFCSSTCELTLGFYERESCHFHDVQFDSHSRCYSTSSFSDSNSEDDMLAQKRHSGPGRMPPDTPPKRSRFGSPMGMPERRPRYCYGNENPGLPPAPPFPFHDDFPPPPCFNNGYQPLLPPTPPGPLPPRHLMPRHPSPSMEVGGLRQSPPPPRPPVPPPVQVMAGDHHTEFDYLYKYGYLDRQERSHTRTQRLGSVSAGYASDHTSRPNGGSRGKQPGDGGGASARGGAGSATGGHAGSFLGGKGTENKWSSPSGQGAGRGQGSPRGGFTRGHAPGQGQPSARGQGRGSTAGVNHKPLPSARAANALYISQQQRGIHSLAVVKNLNVANMSLPEKLLRFMIFLRSEPARVNDIQTVENAVTGTHLDLKTDYQAEDVGVFQNRHVFSGRLLLSGVFLARAVGQTKKELKHECYKLALEVLKTKDVSQILQQRDVGIAEIRRTFEECSASEKPDEPQATQSTSQAAKLANAAPISVAVDTVASPRERWAEFVKCLVENTAQASNPISRLEMALSASRCGLERTYTDCLLQTRTKPTFHGSLSLGGMLQAQAEGSKKKEAKQKTYQLAVQRLTTLTLSEIWQGVEPEEPDKPKVDDKEKVKIKSLAVKEIRTAEQIKRFQMFIDRIKDSSVREGPTALMDVTANQLQLLITCMYKKLYEEGLTYFCQLYIGDILISEGEGRQRKETQLDAYSKAYERLISTPLETILSESHRLNSDELDDPEIEEVVVKGQVRQMESNLPRLRRQCPNPEETVSEKTSEGLVIVEHEDWVHDRKKHAFCILQNSALMNLMLMEWHMHAVTGFFQCKVSIQGEELGSARAGSKQIARNLASADALFKMYETQPVLRIIATEDTQHWITYEQLMAKMKELPESDFTEALVTEADSKGAGKLPQKMKDRLSKDHQPGGADAAAESAEDKEARMLALKLRVVAQKLIEEFCERGDILEEIAFSPELPASIRRFLPTPLAKKGLRSYQRQKDGKMYLAIGFRTRVDKIVEAMRKRGVKKTSKFLLVEEREQLPRHADILLDIESARTIPRRLEAASHSLVKGVRRESGGGSLDGSLFEETVDGFVTAQSSFLAEGNSSTIQPAATPTGQSTPVKDLKQVYTQFVEAMSASGVGQTLLSKSESVGRTTIRNVSVSVAAPTPLRDSTPVAVTKKNILVSPPAAVAGNAPVTIATPKQSLSVAAIPLPESTLVKSSAPVRHTFLAGGSTGVGAGGSQASVSSNKVASTVSGAVVSQQQRQAPRPITSSQFSTTDLKDQGGRTAWNTPAEGLVDARSRGQRITAAANQAQSYSDYGGNHQYQMDFSADMNGYYGNPSQNGGHWQGPGSLGTMSTAGRSVYPMNSSAVYQSARAQAAPYSNASLVVENETRGQTNTRRRSQYHN